MTKPGTIIVASLLLLTAPAAAQTGAVAPPSDLDFPTDGKAPTGDELKAKVQRLIEIKTYYSELKDTLTLWADYLSALNTQENNAKMIATTRKEIATIEKDIAAIGQPAPAPPPYVVIDNAVFGLMPTVGSHLPADYSAAQCDATSYVKQTCEWAMDASKQTLTLTHKAVCQLPATNVCGAYDPTNPKPGETTKSVLLVTYHCSNKPTLLRDYLMKAGETQYLICAP